jgi:hypothetical protein
MHRRNFLLGLIGAAAGGVALSSHANAASGRTPWDDLQDLENSGAPPEDLPAEGASEAQNRRSRRRYGRRGGRRVYRRRFYGRPRGRAYRYWGPRRRRRYWGRRRVCRVVRNRWGYLVRRCWWVW